MAIQLAPDITFEDDWYAVQPVDTQTMAIGEPLYHQQNWSYLIEGTKRALLFDTGSFSRNITGVVERHAHGEVTALPSHMHFDHLGNIERFNNVAVADLAMLRSCVSGGVLTPIEEIFLGSWENTAAPSFTVNEWIAIDSYIDLGDRRLKVLHTPGHSEDSISLFDADRNQLFAADYLYSGELYAQVPGASLPEYLRVAKLLMEVINQDTLICCAHANVGPDGVHSAPRLTFDDLSALHDALLMIQAEASTWTPQPEWHVKISERVALVISQDAIAAWR